MLVYVFTFFSWQGEYVRLWVPELKEIKDGKVHTVWTLSNSVLSSAGVSLGETYPNPIVVAPEWGRHYGKVVCCFQSFQEKTIFESIICL